MRRSASEKMEIIRLVEGTDLPVRDTLRQLGVAKSTFYGWYQSYVEDGFDGLIQQACEAASKQHGTKFSSKGARMNGGNPVQRKHAERSATDSGHANIKSLGRAKRASAWTNPLNR